MIKIGLVGHGNVGSFLANRIPNIQWIVARSIQGTDMLIEYRQISPVDLVIIAVSDDQIDAASEALSHYLPFQTAIVHTSGTMPWDAIHSYFQNRGVLYPLMTLRKGFTPKQRDFPWLIEGNVPEFEAYLLDAANKWNLPAQVMHSDERAKLHVAAVIANNFTNHLYTQSERWMARHHLDFSLLLPLIRETVEKLSDTTPDAAQTGPARRGDLPTIHRHLQLLTHDPDLRIIYEILTASILKQYHASSDNP